MLFDIEVDSLESYKRIALLTKFEDKGMEISIRAKNPDASYIRIYTSTSNFRYW